MKPFDLEAALSGEKVVTRQGLETTQLRLFDATNEDYPLRGVVDGKVKAWDTNGCYFSNLDPSRFDLFMQEEEKQPVVRYKWAFNTNGKWYEYGCFYSDEEAKERFNDRVIKRLDYTRTEFEE